MVEQILASGDRNKSKRAGLWESIRGPSKKVKCMGKVTRERTIIKKFNRFIIFSTIG